MTAPEPVRLWRPIDLAAVAIGNAAGLAVILAAWTGAGHEVVTDRQIGWVDLGIAGLVIIAMANAGWLLAGRRACWRLRHSLLPAERGLPWPASSFVGARAAALDTSPIQAAAGAAAHTPPNLVTSGAAAPAFVASRAMTWFHAPDCRMAAGKNLPAAGEAEHRAAGRRPCAVCLPSAATAEADHR
jgi:hypothetical protein